MNELALIKALIMALEDAVRDFCSSIMAKIVEFITAIVHVVFSWVIDKVPKEFLIGKDMYDEDFVKSVLKYGDDFLIAIGIALLAIIAMWQVAKTFFSFAGLNGELEEPWKIGIKIMIFAALVVNSYAICKFIITGPVDKVVDMMLSIDTKVEKGNIQKVISSSSNLARSKKLYVADNFSVVFSSFSGTGLTFSIVKMVIVIIVDFKIFKFVLSIVQKYINMVVYILLSPIAFACGVSRATNFALKGWINLFVGGIAVQIFQIAILRIISAYGSVISSANNFNWSLIFVYLAATLAMSKMEEYLAELGLSGGVQIKFAIGSNVKKGGKRVFKLMMK